MLGSLCVGHVGQTDTARALCVCASLGSLCCTWSLGVSAVEVGVFRCPQQSHLAHMFPLPKHLRSPGLEVWEQHLTVIQQARASLGVICY